MTTRILLADQAEARFYEYDRTAGTLRPVGALTNPTARMHDRDLKSDRPGRVFDHAASPTQRRGSVAHHATGGEESPKHHEVVQFVARIVQELESARASNQLDRLVVVAGPKFMGMLRAEMSTPLRELVCAEVLKDLMHEPQNVLLSHLTPELLRA